MPPASSSTAPSKEALAIILDVSHSMSAAQLDAIKQTCNDFIIQKMLYSPSDEVGLLFAGTNGTKNRLHSLSNAHYKNITVMRPVMKPSGDYMADVAAAAKEGGPLDMFEAILCAADLISESTKDKKYNRRIMLMSQAADQVRNKKALTEVQSGLANAGISLVIIGVDFSVTDDQDWSALTTTKQQNERVLAIICKQLGDTSFIFPVSDAIEALGSLRKRNVSERTTSRAVLTIGDVRIAVFMYSKTLQARVPTLKKAADTVDSTVTIDRRYFIAGSMSEVEPSERVKVLKYGRSVVPCATIDEEQMKFISERSLDCLGFINISDIPPHILTGGCKAVGPAAGDGEGASALAAFVQGMVHLNKAMLVRFVRCANASPTVCACIPSSKPERHILYMVSLPYAGDFRKYQLPDFSEVSLSASENKSISDMVTSMMVVGADEPKLNKIYNPSLQQYYTWVRARFLQGRCGGPAASGKAPPSVIGQPLPLMPDAVKESATCWGEPGNVLHDKHKAARGFLEKVAKDFPFTPPVVPNAPGAGAKNFWFKNANGAMEQVGIRAVSGEPSSSRGARTEVSTSASAAPMSESDHYFSASGGTQQSEGQPSTPGPGGHHANGPAFGVGGERAVAAISTSNPVESFLAMISNKQIDQVDEAIFRMGELVLTLLKLSIGPQFYSKCELCIRALRKVCVEEDESPAYFAFLQKVMLMTKGGPQDQFWTQHVVAAALGPITVAESPSSVITVAEANQFMTNGIKAPAPPQIDDEMVGVDEILDQLE